MKNKLWVPIVVLLISGCQGGQGPGVVEAQEVAEAMEVTEFVRQTYFEGVPYEEAARYDASAVPALLEMLSNSENEAYWGNIVAVLGIVADEQGVQAMIDFIDQASEETLSRDHFRAKTSALISLGYAVNKNGNAQALDYLKSWVDPEAMATVESMVAWRSPVHETDRERDAQLSKMAILGLALAGTEEAGEVLRGIQEPQQTERAREFQAAVSDMLSEAISANETIAQDGLSEYYRKSKFGGSS